jgi:hypothetical protein
MSWHPTSEEDLWHELNSASSRMNPKQQRIWGAIRIIPRKWALSPWGDLGGGFWVVALLGERVVWFNDIEDGFNLSRFSSHGTIDEYWCNQDKLEWTIQGLLNEFEGLGPNYRLGPPQPVVLDDTGKHS